MTQLLLWIDGLLNRVTMYRTVLYFLCALFVVAFAESLVGILSYGAVPLIASAVFLMAACIMVNQLFSWAFRAPVNIESAYITALILVFLINPPTSWADSSYFWMAGWSAVIAMAAKYVLAIRHKHVFNPAAIGVAIVAAAVGLSASWWVATVALMPFVLVGGILITRKIRRADLMLAFFATAIPATLWGHTSTIAETASNLWHAVALVPLLFFAFVMLTEPLTTPPTRPWRIAYGALVGLLFYPSFHIGNTYFTPELALLAGNVFSYVVSPKEKLILTLARVRKLATDTYEYVFTPDQKARYSAGQYLEWTLAHDKSDSRGNRRYFTVASSPEMNEVTLGVKFYPKASSFKRALAAMHPGDTLVASQVAGDFTLPRNTKTPLVFIAGGIGVTPFASMTRHMLAMGERRPVTMFYANRTVDDIAYADVFDEASQKLGMRVINVLSDVTKVPLGWKGRTGTITADTIKAEVPDWNTRTFYISGPQGMVSAFKTTLRAMGVPRRRIHSDFFPGFA